jgi:hypothetical protein
VARTTDLMALVAADWRRLALWLLGGWSVFGLVLLLAMVDLGCRGCPPGTVSLFTTQKVVLFCLVYALSPWVFSVHAVHHGIGMLTGLPLSQRDINRFILVRGLVLGLLCLPAWAFVLWLLPGFGFTIPPWLAVSSLLGVLAYQLLGMVTGQVVRVAVAAVFPLLIFPPHSPRVLAGPLNFAATPWAAVLLAVLIALAVPRVLAHPLPRAERRA